MTRRAGELFGNSSGSLSLLPSLPGRMEDGELFLFLPLTCGGRAAQVFSFLHKWRAFHCKNCLFIPAVCPFIYVLPTRFSVYVPVCNLCTGTLSQRFVMVAKLRQKASWLYIYTALFFFSQYSAGRPAALSHFPGTLHASNGCRHCLPLQCDMWL